MAVTNVYIDGFNLFYGALRKTPYRWLNLEKMCQLLLADNTIGEIKYFTAKVSARPDDLDQPVRQQLYLRALATLPKVSLHYGHFLTPIRLVRETLGKKVGALNPHKNPSRAMLPHLDFYKPIREGVLRESQFDVSLRDRHGVFSKPAAW